MTTDNDTVIDRKGLFKGDDADDHLNITIKDPQGSEFRFKVKKSTRMRKLFQAFCKRSGTGEGAMRFFHQECRIDDEQTPAELGLQDGDMIDAFVRQVAGGSGSQVVLR
jgi:small ubiquitin-related modifier